MIITTITLSIALLTFLFSFLHEHRIVLELRDENRKLTVDVERLNVNREKHVQTINDLSRTTEVQYDNIVALQQTIDLKARTNEKLVEEVTLQTTKLVNIRKQLVTTINDSRALKVSLEIVLAEILKLDEQQDRYHAEVMQKFDDLNVKKVTTPRASRVKKVTTPENPFVDPTTKK